MCISLFNNYDTYSDVDLNEYNPIELPEGAELHQVIDGVDTIIAKYIKGHFATEQN